MGTGKVTYYYLYFHLILFFHRLLNKQLSISVAYFLSPQPCVWRLRSFGGGKGVKFQVLICCLVVDEMGKRRNLKAAF